MKQAEGLKFTKENDIRNFNKINSFNLQNEFLNLKYRKFILFYYISFFKYLN